MEEALAREVPRLIQEIRLRAGRRSLRARRGRFWVARILRENVQTGGVPFVIPFRTRRPRRPDVLVLADVSWSVLRASATFLLLAQSFLRVGRRTSVHLFVDRCVEATRPLARWRADLGPASMARLLASVPGLDLGAPSDYGRAFYQAAHSRHAPVRARRRDTILVVLGDARGNYRDPQAWAFEDLAARCRRVIWLNPEPAERWDTGDSVLAEYLPSCDVVCEARDLAGLARGVSELVKAL